MPVTILVGAQWGDEGKGRVADWLAAESDVVARYAGGDNAGHTVYVGDDVFKLHLVPSGILHERVTCVLGNGMVVNPVNLMREIEGIKAQGVDVNPARLVSARGRTLSRRGMSRLMAHRRRRWARARSARRCAALVPRTWTRPGARACVPGR